MSVFHEKNVLVKSFLLLCIITLSARAAITPVGDISPADPASWNIATDGYVGKTADGSLVINGGSVLSSDSSYLGYNNNVTGSVTVDGTGSSWTNDYIQYIGYSGIGTLTITGGGQVDTRQGYLGANAGSTGTAIVSGDGSKWTVDTLGISRGSLRIEAGGEVSDLSGSINSKSSVTVTGTDSKWINENSLHINGVKGQNSLTVADGGVVSAKILYASLDNLSGDGLITTQGFVLDGDLVFDAAHGPQSPIPFGTSGRLTLGSTEIPLLGVGYHGIGTMKIADGVSIVCSSSLLGNFSSSSTGTVTVTGAGSKWTINKELFVGASGKGLLNIEAGGQVSSATGGVRGVGSIVSISGTGSKWICNGLGVGATININEGGAIEAGSCSLDESIRNRVGIINVSGVGSKLSASSGLNVGLYGRGILNVLEGGQTSGSGILGTLSGSTGTVTIHGAGSKWTSDKMIVGSDGNGTLNIEDGGQLSSVGGYLGSGYDATGTVRVTGAGSMWTNSDFLCVGENGNATLRIDAGGQVSNTLGYVGTYGDRVCMVTVDGSGSKWTNSSDLIIRSPSASSALNITGGGAVTAQMATLYKSVFSIDVGTGSSLSINNGTGTFNNNGKVRILAGAGPSANAVFSPISATTWGGTGTYQPVGGTWNSTTHEFTVSGVQNGDSGVPISIDRSTTQRTLIGDAASTWKLGASFAATDAPAALTFTATAIGDGPLDSLKALLSGDPLLGGWNLASDAGYSAGDPIYLSFKNGIGGEYTSQAMQVWSYDGTTWSKYAADDLTYDGTYASFTTTTLGCYAVSVPEPATFVLLILGFGGLLIGYGRKK